MHTFGPLMMGFAPSGKGWLAVTVDGPRGRTGFEVRDFGFRGPAVTRAVLDGLQEAFSEPARFRRRALEAPMPGSDAYQAFGRETEAILKTAREIGPAVLEAQKASRMGLSGAEEAMDLKRALMELGNRLVTETRFVPSGPIPQEIREALRVDHSTEPITLFTEWLNLHPEARDVLAEMGIEWRMPG